MEFSAAVKKSIKEFVAGKVPPQVSDMKEGGLYYTPSFFDEYEKQYSGEESKKGDDDATV
jgi:hypothetical protein